METNCRTTKQYKGETELRTSIFIAFPFLLFVGIMGLLIFQVGIFEEKEIFDTTYYMKYYDTSNSKIIISSLKLYPNIIEVNDYTILKTSIINYENDEKVFHVSYNIKHDPEYWYIQQTGTGKWFKTDDEVRDAITIKSLDSAGTKLTDVIQVKIHDKNMNLIDQRDIPIHSTADMEWLK